MPTAHQPIPSRRTDLVIKPIGDDGRYVVKDPQSGDFFQIGEEEHFLLQQLDGERNANQICAAFEQRFGESLTGEDLDGFLEMVAGQGLLEASSGYQPADSSSVQHAPASGTNQRADARRSPKRQSILYWRKSLFDPDRFFNWLEPKIRFFWTRGFLLFSAACIVFACGLLWMNRGELATSFRSALRWETVVVTWVVMLVVITLHEFAHGLTCKHYGGEVREIGFLLMFFMPCFYCNVSDAWLFREKSKRLWVTFAGGYFELFLWALAVFVWRLTALDSGINYIAFLIVAAAGVQSLFNFNPLIKLDGYYLLSDWMEVPNLRQRSIERAKAWFRRLLWGGPKPEASERGRFLTGFGFVSWTFSIVFLTSMLIAMAALAADWFGTTGVLAVGLFGVVTTRGLLQGTSSGEFKTMITKRMIRTLCWLSLLGGIVAGLCFIEVEEYFSGDFTLRPVVRKEVRGPVAGFVKEIRVKEGDTVSPGDVIAVLEIPDLASRIEQKQAELNSAEADLKLLREGTRPEQIADQKERIARAERWRDAASRDLLRLEKTLEAELNALKAKVAAAVAARGAAKSEKARIANAVAQQAATQADLDAAREKLNVAEANVKRAEADVQARKAQGNILAEQEVIRRAKELSEQRAALKLLQAGSRPQEIAAGVAKVDRAKAELKQMRRIQSKLDIRAEIAGVVVTPRLREKIGSHLKEGETLCLIEDRSSFEAEIALTEQKIAAIRPGQHVSLKARGLPFDNLNGEVLATAQSAAARDHSQSAIVVYCRIETPRTTHIPLRSAMTGHARIYTTRKSIGQILLDRSLRLLRTEFWW